jgi:hypothetical protein
LQLKKSLFTRTHIYPLIDEVLCNGENYTLIYWFYTNEDKGLELWGLCYVYFELILFYNIFTNNLLLFLCPIHWCVYVSMLTISASSQSCVLLISFIGFMPFYVVTISYCSTHMISVVYYCISSVIVIHSCNIPLFLMYLAYCGCIWVAIISVKMCLSINNINVSGNTK